MTILQPFAFSLVLDYSHALKALDTFLQESRVCFEASSVCLLLRKKLGWPVLEFGMTIAAMESSLQACAQSLLYFP